MLDKLDVILVDNCCKCIEVSWFGNNDGLWDVSKQICQNLGKVHCAKHIDYFVCWHWVVDSDVVGPLFAGLDKCTKHFVECKCISKVLLLVFGRQIRLSQNCFCNARPNAQNLLLGCFHFWFVVGCIGQNYARALDMNKVLLGVFHIRQNANTEGQWHALCC